MLNPVMLKIGEGGILRDYGEYFGEILAVVLAIIIVTWAIISYIQYKRRNNRDKKY